MNPKYQLALEIKTVACQNVASDAQHFEEACQIKTDLMEFLEKYETTNQIILAALDLAAYCVAAEIRDRKLRKWK